VNSFSLYFQVMLKLTCSLQRCVLFIDRLQLFVIDIKVIIFQPPHFEIALRHCQKYLSLLWYVFNEWLLSRQLLWNRRKVRYYLMDLIDSIGCFIILELKLNCNAGVFLLFQFFFLRIEVDCFFWILSHGIDCWSCLT